MTYPPEKEVCKFHPETPGRLRACGGISLGHLCDECYKLAVEGATTYREDMTITKRILKENTNPW